MDGLKVLLVDDEEDFLTLLARRLRRRKLDVRCATTAEEALRALAQDPVAVAVLDIRLPGMDGLATLERIRAEHRSTQVIMLTGFTDTSLVQEALELGAFAYLIKPVDVRELLEKIREAAALHAPAPSAHRKSHDSS